MSLFLVIYDMAGHSKTAKRRHCRLEKTFCQIHWCLPTLMKASDNEDGDHDDHLL